MKLAVDWPEPETGAELGTRDFEQIRRLAYTACGLDLKPGKEELVSARLRRLVRDGGFPSFQEYYRYVVADRTGAALAAMIDALATNHTSFLREWDHFAFLRERVVPSLAGRHTVEVWSAACSTGEEVWTLAMVLSEALGKRRFSILGTDISNKALRAAKEAEYSEERCQGIPAAWRARYLVAEKGPGKSYLVAPRLRAQADFRRVNLMEPFPWQRQFPIVFCRNVMIYFDRRTQEQLVQRLAAALEPGGYLFVGHAESLTRISHPLEFVRPAVYQRPAEKEGYWSRSL